MRVYGRGSGPPRRGFTLIELLVVIAILALLAAIIIPGLSRAQQRAQTTTCLNNLRQVCGAVHAFTVDRELYLPPGNAHSNGLRRSHRASYKDTTDNKAQIAYWVAPYLGMPRPDAVLRECPTMRCPRAARLKSSNQTWENFVTYAIYQGAGLGYHPFGAMNGERSHRITDIDDQSGTWMLTDADRKNDPGHTPQADLLDTPAHGDKRNVVFFDGHVLTLPKGSVTIDNAAYAR